MEEAAVARWNSKKKKNADLLLEADVQIVQELENLSDRYNGIN